MWVFESGSAVEVVLLCWGRSSVPLQHFASTTFNPRKLTDNVERDKSILIHAHGIVKEWAFDYLAKEPAKKLVGQRFCILT
ncbi:uncharacterized protein BO95DRAFT_104367 [Aspergillus brunneoviolaceus CBS 621.78]|uniref:Uncharacterized protein n=1 Tax=Aspergillus brunneoviolaceus CBS 621.78 TaxID=1450534 RepID=A0ACD1GBG7_9EURO|nr:hypothetical protein BO95DRAFT_104367 [Aspergillus brunneoviolaceus CBS 621.78]RAH46602.1 hypothetical protein BO95DRAFT_104367 [Aspergillus brunneoviolaceus CBS 621.78]